MLLKDARLRNHIPLTKRLSLTSLSQMLHAYQMVYVKPVFGSMGRGVMRVWSHSPSYDGANDGASGYAYQLAGRKRSFRTLSGLYRAIRKDAKGKSYLVQQGVHLLSYEGRPYDFRVVVQRSPAGEWEATGTVARIAHPGKIVTNGSQGGTILPAEQVLQPYSPPYRIKEQIRELEAMGLATARKLRSTFPQQNEYGLDIAVDRNMKPWILEVNTRPDHCPFAILQDQTMIRRIVSYGSHYGRTYKLNCNKAKTTL